MMMMTMTIKAIRWCVDNDYDYVDDDDNDDNGLHQLISGI